MSALAAINPVAGIATSLVGGKAAEKAIKGIMAPPPTPAAPEARVAPAAGDSALDAAAAAERKKSGSNKGTFLSLLGDTSGSAVKRKTLLGS